MHFRRHLELFVRELRREGIPVSPDALAEGFRALLWVDWEEEEIFHAALSATLVKESSYRAIFDRVYRRFFFGKGIPGEAASLRQKVENRLAAEEGLDGVPGADRVERVEGPGREGAGKTETGRQGAGTGPGKDGSGGGKEAGLKKDAGGGREKFKSLLEKDFVALTGDELKSLEALLPVVARRLTAKMVRRRRKECAGSLDFRRTFRHSLSTGGTCLELYTRPRVREKPVIFALCDVSASVWEFSCFSLALVHSLERFFRRVRSFAFVDEVAEITFLLRGAEPRGLRSRVHREAGVVREGRTDYGHCLKSFLERYGGELDPRGYLLVFGDARNNWFGSEPRALAALRGKVRRVFWFNPEERTLWDSGDSVMGAYAKSCHRVFACPNLRELERAFDSL